MKLIDFFYLGWFAGHLAEPNFSADWGDYVSFLAHMREKAKKLGVDLIVIDTGDRHDGTGLSDATYPDGEITQAIFKDTDYDFVTLGNHELYREEVSLQEYNMISQYYGDRYLSSNVDILLENDTWVPFGNKYHVFTTPNQQLTILSFGFMFDFSGFNWRTNVHPALDIVDQDWFQEAIRTPDIDVILLPTHIPVRGWSELDIIFHAIREANPYVPIQFFGGHTHIRDFRVLDKYSTALESGRFLETIGWLSIDNITRHNNDGANGYAPPPEFSRTYIDFNVHSLANHSDTCLSDCSETDVPFETEEGLKVSKYIKSERKNLNLTDTYGVVPRNYYTTAAKYPGDNNLFTLLAKKVLPNLEGEGDLAERKDNPRYIIFNTGSIRFDLLKGPYTRDSGYTVSPFKNNWIYIPDLPKHIADEILKYLNGLDYITSEEAKVKLAELNTPIDNARINLEKLSVDLENIYCHFCANHQIREQKDSMDENSQEQKSKKSNLLKNTNMNLGYVTHDDYGKIGDDTPHLPQPNFPLPNAVQTEQNVNPSDYDTPIDYIFYDFVGRFILIALEDLGYTEVYNATSLRHYGGKDTAQLLQEYAIGTWGTEAGAESIEEKPHVHVSPDDIVSTGILSNVCVISLLSFFFIYPF